MRDPDNAHWRDSARTPRFFIMDAYAAIPLVLFLLHIRWWMFFTCLAAVFFFAAIEKVGFTLPVFKRWFRAFFAGDIRTSRPWWS